MIRKLFFKVKVCSDLTINERLVYYYICFFANKEGISNASVNNIMINTGIKDRHTISGITKSLVNKGYITKDYIIFDGCKRMAIYKLINMDSGFTCISTELLDANISKQAMVLAISLSSLRINGGVTMNMSHNEICKKIGISKPTFIKYIKELLDNNVLSKNESTYIFNSDYFKVFPVKTNEAKEDEKCLKCYPKDGRKYKVFMYYYERNYSGVKNIAKLLRSILDETYFHKKDKSEFLYDLTPKEYEF